MREHPCHSCPDREEHARWAQRLWQVERELDRLTTGLARRQGSIAASFDRVCAVLDEIGYLRGDTVTPHGQRLRGLFGDLDLVAAECVRRGILDPLDAPELAACVSALTFTSRGDEPVGMPRPPSPRVRDAIEAMETVAADLRDVEARHGTGQLRDLDAGISRAAYRWTSGQGLATVLAEAEMDAGLTAGDFVRSMRQMLDMLDQVAAVADGPAARTARQAGGSARRGVVSYELDA